MQNLQCLTGQNRIVRLLILLVWILPALASAEDSTIRPFTIGIEAGSVWFPRNDVRIPGDSGTRFDMTELTGSGPEFFTRVDGRWRIDERHSLRLVVALLEVTGTGTLDEETGFAGGQYVPGATEGIYQFNTYKLTYRYSLPERGRWRWGIGFTAVVRDANVELRQNERVSNDDNVGFVPTLHLSGHYRMSDRWALEIDADGLAGGPGRLFDLATRLSFGLNEAVTLGAGYRALEGGVDTDDVFNFAWISYALLDAQYHF